MGHGKETPRQKMIGMMYLVLMALLALNVSKEVLDAFAVLDSGLVNTIANLEKTNEKIISDFAVQFELNSAKVKPFQDLAWSVRDEANKIVQFIQDKKIEMVKESEGDDTEAINEEGHINGALIDGKDNTEIPARHMVGDDNQKAGKELKEKIEDFRNFLISQVVTAENAIPVRTSIESSLDTKPFHREEKTTEVHTWESDHFEHSPLSGVLTVMSGLQIDIRNAESAALNYLYSRIDEGSVPFNRIDATVIPNSNYIIRGNEYRAEVFLAASDSTASPKIYVTQHTSPYDSVLSDDGNSYTYIRKKGLKYDSLTVERGTGKGIFKLPGSGLGTKHWGGIIELTGPSGKITKPFKNSFLVAEGSVSVAPTKMNVFYLGVDNPVDVSVAGVEPDKIDISVTNARHVKRRGSYIIKPIRPGNSFVIVYAKIDGVKREMARKEFRVRTVPTPRAMVNNQIGGKIKKNVLMAQLGVVADMEDFEFDLTFTITEFTVSAVLQGFNKQYTSKSNRFTAAQKNLIKSLSRGNNLYIQDIKAVGPDGATRDLSAINFKLN